MIRSPATLGARVLPVSRYSTMSGAISVESMRTRTGASVSLRIWCAPSLPRGDATTAPRRGARSAPRGCAAGRPCGPRGPRRARPGAAGDGDGVARARLLLALVRAQRRLAAEDDRPFLV